MTKLSSRVTAVLVLAFMAFFMLFTFFGKKENTSENENRPLAGRPGFSLSEVADGITASQLSTYTADHFAMRDVWIKLNAAIRAEVGEGIINGVYIADDMLLDAQASGRARADESIRALNSFAERYNGAIYVVAVPTSSGVYREKLPEQFDTYRESQQISDIYDKLNRKIKRIDAYNILKMLNKNYIYYRSDNKWTSYGAYCVYRTVIQRLGFMPTTYDKYSVHHATSDFRGDLYNRSQYDGIRPDIIDFYSCNGGAEIISCTGYYNSGKTVEKHIYDEKLLDMDYMYNAYLGEEVPLLKITTTVKNERKLLVIKDDYADCFIPFLTQHYSEIDVVSPELIEGKISDHIRFSDYEQVLFLFGIENLSKPDILSTLS